MKLHRAVAPVPMLVGLLALGTPAVAADELTPGPVAGIGTIKTAAIQLTEADSGRTLTVSVGQRLRVTLPGGAAGGYHQPTASGPAVRRVAASGGFPSEDPAVARFVAVQTGQASLDSITDFTCFDLRPPCAVPQKLWRVDIVVR